MSSIYSKLKYLENTKEMIGAAIESKGGFITQDDSFRSYAQKILDMKVEEATGDGKLKNLDVKPTGTEFVINATDKNCTGFNSVAVAGDDNLVPENIRDGVKIYGMSGKYRGENAVDLTDSKTVTPNGKDISVFPDGDDAGIRKVIVKGDKNLIPSNVKQGVTIYGVEGTHAGSAETGTISIVGGIRVMNLIKINGIIDVQPRVAKVRVLSNS